MKKILIAEDDVISRYLLNIYLRNFDFSVEEVGNGLDAISILKKEKFDIILMDMQMPYIDGIEATKIIRNELNINTITDFLVIAFSSNNVGNKASTFTSLAVFMRQASDVGIHLWLNWSPPHVPLKS